MWKTMKAAAYALYARRLNAQLAGATLPRHVAIVMDGNRRWARQEGFPDARIGHRYGAEHLDEVLHWCDIAGQLTADRIATHLYTSGQPDPDLVIRTSGERRMSGFLLWPAAYAELHFTDVYWPGFRKVGFLRALRSYAARHRRFGA